MRDETAEGLPGRLRAMMIALNLSRVALARDMGVDKSVVGRWLAGTTRPTEHNLARLTELLRRVDPAATMGHWQAAPEAAASREPATRPTVLTGLHMPRSEEAAQRCAGLWAGMFATSEGSRLRPCVVEIADDGGTLTARLWDGTNEARGLAMAGPSWLNLLLQVTLFEERLWTIVLHSPSTAALEVTTGVMTTGFPGLDEPPAVTSCAMAIVRVGDGATAARLRAGGEVAARLMALRRRIGAERELGPDGAEVRMGLLDPALAHVFRPAIGHAHADGGTAFAMRMGRAVCMRLSTPDGDRSGSPVSRTAAAFRTWLGLEPP